MNLSLDTISKGVKKISKEYPIKKVILFGSYADGTFTNESDIDLLVEFKTESISLFTLSGLKIGLEEILDKKVDVLHAPLPDECLIPVGEIISAEKYGEKHPY